MSTETVSQLELLGRVCDRHGWALCLGLKSHVGTPAQAQEEPSRLSYLDVLQPSNDPPTRAARLRLGRTLATATVRDAARLDEAAQTCLRTLKPRLEARRSA